MEEFKEKIVKWSHKIAGEQEFQAGYKVDVQQITGEGYSSANFRITICDPKRELKMFGKVAKIMDDLRETSYVRLYTDEVYFYTNVVNIFNKIENRHNVPKEDRCLLPKFYGGDSIPREETVILEDLSHRGFVSPDQRQAFDWEFASKSVEQLAKYHALSFVYGVECPSDFAKMLESKPYHVFDSDVMRRLGFEQTVPMSVAALGEGDLQQRVRQYLSRKDRHAELVRMYRDATPRVLAHGDFKTNNLMYRHHKGRLEVVPVDFQNIHAGSPATDLVYLVMLGSDEGFRTRHLRALLDHYHAELARALSRRRVVVQDVYPRAALEEEWNAALPIGLAVALMILPILLPNPAVEVEQAADNAGIAEKVRSNVELSSRLQGIVRDYIQWGIL